MTRKKYALLASSSAMLLVVLSSLVSAQLFWQAYSYWLISTTAASKTTISPSKKTALTIAPNYANDISNAHLFGRTMIAEEVDLSTAVNIPTSMLEVVIKGILSLDDGLRSMAILSVENAADKVYKTGDTLTKGYRVHQITPNGLVADHNGRLEMIRLPRSTWSQITSEGPSASINSSASLASLRTEILRNPLALEQYIIFAPHSLNGGFSGYRVKPGNRPEMFVKLGLKVGDIISSIDDVGIGELAGRMDILTNLSVAKSLRIGIVRNSQKQQLLVDFSQW